MIIVQMDKEELKTLIHTEVQKAISETNFSDRNNEQNDLLTVKDAATFLSLSVPTVYNLISRGELPYMKRSKRCYFSKAELSQYIRNGRKKTNLEVAEAADPAKKLKKKS